MTFLDYKLFILIGLSIVIYFLYKEITSLKNKFKYLNNKFTMLNPDIQLLKSKKNYYVFF